MQDSYTLKVQAIRSKGQRPRLYVYLPASLAEAIGLTAGEEVSWEVLDRGELHLVRARPASPRTNLRALRS
jgi:antitoxin component of MazEF toxin-antitoxin module